MTLPVHPLVGRSLGEVPDEDLLKVAPRYERDLARQLDQTTAALRAEVGRRRLEEIGRE